jgi:hypothetical protein
VFTQSDTGKLVGPVRYTLADENCYDLKLMDLNGIGREHLATWFGEPESDATTGDVADGQAQRRTARHRQFGRRALGDYEFRRIGSEHDLRTGLATRSESRGAGQRDRSDDTPWMSHGAGA